MKSNKDILSNFIKNPSFQIIDWHSEDKTMDQLNEYNELDSTELQTYNKLDKKLCSWWNWWKENSVKWSSVRSVWDKIYEKDKDLTLKVRVNKMKLYEYLLFSDNYDSPDSHENLINSFVID